MVTGACGSAGKESAWNPGDLGLIPGLGKSPRDGKCYLLQYSGLENCMDCPWDHKESDTTERLSLSLHSWKDAKSSNDMNLMSLQVVNFIQATLLGDHV